MASLAVGRRKLFSKRVAELDPAPSSAIPSQLSIRLYISYVCTGIVSRNVWAEAPVDRGLIKSKQVASLPCPARRCSTYQRPSLSLGTLLIQSTAAYSVDSALRIGDIVWFISAKFYVMMNITDVMQIELTNNQS